MNKKISAQFSLRGKIEECGKDEQYLLHEKLKLLENDFNLHYSLSVRNDSRLAYMYVKGDTRLSRKDVLEEMATIQWICSNTRYVEICEAVMQEIAIGMKKRYRLRNWSTVWTVVREYAPDIIKYSILHDKHIPNLKRNVWSDDI